MPEISTGRNTVIVKKEVQPSAKLCYHCGTECTTNNIAIGDKLFCCDGCKLVYEILDKNGLCNYYELQSHPGLSQIKPLRNDKYAYLDNEQIAEKLYKFTDGNITIVTLYLPQAYILPAKLNSDFLLCKIQPALDNGRV